MNKYLKCREEAIKGNADNVHMMLIHDLKIPCEMMKTATNGHYNINLRLNILENIATMHQGKSINGSKSWGCPGRRQKSKNYAEVDICTFYNN